MENKKITIQDKYNKYLADLLEEKLFESASNIHAGLVEQFAVTPENARKIVSRAVKSRVIRSSDPYTFGKGQFVYIRNGYELGKYAVMAITQKSRPPIFRLLEIMDLNNGIISYYEGLKITASPLEESSTKIVALDDIITLLMKLDILYKEKDKNGVVYLIYKDFKEKRKKEEADIMMASHFLKMVTDCSILPDILRWLGNSNLIDFAGVLYRNKKTPQIGVQHYNLIWDAVASSRATGINPILGAKADSQEKQTLAVLDVVLSSDYTQSHLDAFIARIQITRKSAADQTRKLMPIIIYRSATKLTMNIMRKNGIIAFNISTIFGTKIFHILNGIKDLSGVFKAADNIDAAVENILKTISNSGQNDALKELRGTLFEFLMYPLLKTLYPNASIDRGRILTMVHDDGKKENYEYDYIIESSNPPELVLVELKGYNASATINLGDSSKHSTLRWFFRRTLPFAEKYYKSTIEKSKQIKAVFITSANFYEDGREFISKMNNSKYISTQLNTGYEREELLALLKKFGFESEIRIIKKFYAGTDQEEFEMVIPSKEPDDLPF
ncbi:hypothetical protein [Flavobacterium anhuiense]|uniref:hypothetical protein n=1 Tax=Flavobacterium anhuiense TaxID=459526 RepID=UPI000E6BF63F|nr:hypothetical protein [Flavobacterium anhuiense]